jgi:hypothetical protein
MHMAFDSGRSPARYRVALVLANSFAVRNTLHTPVLAELAARRDLEVAILTPYPENAQVIAATGAGHLSWALLHRPVEGVGLTYGGPLSTALRLTQRLCMRPLLGVAGFGNLVYRFNEIHQFRGHVRKKSLPPERRAREALAGNFVESSLGRPWPRSRGLFRLLYRLHYATWYNEPAVEAFFDIFRPQLLAIHHLQFANIHPYNTGARRRGIPITGIVASWDQPTTKGPLCPGVDQYLVQSSRMAEELTAFHGVDRRRVLVTGWPQMDYYQQPGVLGSRQELLKNLGLPPTARYVLLGANSARLGAHEPGIAAHLAHFLAREPLGKDVSLLVRPHPNDGQWSARFGSLPAPPRVLVMAPEWGRLDFLANLVRHAQVLVSTGGSISLDALALDTPVVNIGFDGDLSVTPADSVRRLYETEHYEAVVRSGGVRLAESYAQLEQAISDYLRDPAQDAQGRAQGRQEQLEPLDGQASRRLVDALAANAKLAAAQGIT